MKISAGKSRRITSFSISEFEQDRFSSLSGDHNPIHKMRDIARKTVFGDVVVHGINALLRATELAHQALQLPLQRTTFISVQFSKPIYVGERVDLFLVSLDERAARLVVRAGVTDLLKIRLNFDASPKPCSALLVGLGRTTPPSREAPLRNINQPLPPDSMPLRVDAEALNTAFPALSAVWGEQLLASITLLSTIVGMEWPGLNSLFVEAKIDFRKSDLNDLNFSVLRSDPERGFTIISVSAPDIDATLMAFFRPPPVVQASAKELATKVMHGEFSGVRAIVVGASKGLGEIAAKLLAAGGAEVVLTSRSIGDDLKRVSDSITDIGGFCTTSVFDTAALETSTLPTAFQKPELTLLLYFASPQIFRRRSAHYMKEWLSEFTAVYVDGVVNAISQILESTEGPLGVFYPSTEALNFPMGELIEYTAAKAAGEAVCATLATENPRIHLLSPRLPRLLTDQTNSIVAVDTPDPADLLLPYLRGMREHCKAIS
ncbi:MAG: SDR family NAD(P)-dependent oxidoreductase [Gammaproteobacteria bacterium]|nr:SDR family NAD(P)-dependent oxidoreductase [Gammaproteobacteria bacterium]